MKIIKLIDLQEEIKRNNERYKDIIEAHTQKLQNDPNMKKGRVRPRHPDEKRILDSFQKK